MNGRRFKDSTTSDGAHPATWSEEALLQACRVERLRRSGPGGQHRNKVETGVRLVHAATGLRAEAFERRSQQQNRTAAVHRLRVLLALEVRGVPVADGASALWRSRLAGKTIRCSDAHPDFPALLAESLDVLAEVEFDVHAAAERLACSHSQLIKFLKTEPRALARVNRERVDRGLHVLR